MGSEMCIRDRVRVDSQLTSDVPVNDFRLCKIVDLSTNSIVSIEFKQLEYRERLQGVVLTFQNNVVLATRSLTKVVRRHIH